jgi:hypothetical protein
MITLASRIRRVKCDETKPECERCVKGRFKCDGYSGRANRPASQLKSSRALAPLKPLSRMPTLQLFKSEPEYRQFQHFCREQAAQLTGYRDTQLWSRVVLQACETNASIRHAGEETLLPLYPQNIISQLKALTSKIYMLTCRAVIAIGCLNWKEWAPESDDEIPKMQREFAYDEYAKAITGLRKSIADGSCDLRTKIISCLLFATFGMCPRIELFSRSFLDRLTRDEYASGSSKCRTCR